MAQYISKDALVAEINKRIIDAPVNNIGHQRVWAYNDVRDITNTLEVKTDEDFVETKWISYKEQKPPYGVEVLAYHHDWVDEDFNPKGIRVGFLQENLAKDNDLYDFVSAFWWNYQDCYMTISKVVCGADDNSKAFYQDHLDCIEPEYWMEIPKFL